MSNVSSSNSAQINDPTLEAYILAGLEETNQTIRNQIYDDLQQYVVEELRPWAFGYVKYVYKAYDQHLTGFQQNAMGKFYFYPCEWVNVDILDPEISGFEMWTMFFTISSVGLILLLRKKKKIT